MNAREPVVLVVGADPSTRELLREWLADAGWSSVDGEPADATNGVDVPGLRPALVLVDLAFPRHGRAETLQRIAQTHAGVPVLALSATFHASAEGSGQIAQSLGVAGVLPKPVRREALVNAVRRLSRMSS